MASYASDVPYAVCPQDADASSRARGKKTARRRTDHERSDPAQGAARCCAVARRADAP
jgi:hypothetical protein